MFHIHPFCIYFIQEIGHYVKLLGEIDRSVLLRYASSTVVSEITYYQSWFRGSAQFHVQEYQDISSTFPIFYSNKITLKSALIYLSIAFRRVDKDAYKYLESTIITKRIEDDVNVENVAFSSFTSSIASGPDRTSPATIERNGLLYLFGTQDIVRNVESNARAPIS